jgi:hypothetical protein
MAKKKTRIADDNIQKEFEEWKEQKQNENTK